MRLDANGIPVILKVPTHEDIRDIVSKDAKSLKSLMGLLVDWDLEDPNELRRFQMQYLQRFNITPGEPRFEEAYQRLAEESNSKRVVVAHARRKYQIAQTIAASSGNLNQEGIYINDGDDPCDECLALGGEQQPISWFAENNAMPGDRCLGGSNCKCTLIPVN